MGIWAAYALSQVGIRKIRNVQRDSGMAAGYAPYAMGKMDVMAPICVMSMPSVGSATMTGAVYVRLLRVR